MFRSLVQNVYLRQYIDCNFVDNKGNPNPWAEQVYHSLSFSFLGGGGWVCMRGVQAAHVCQQNWHGCYVIGA
jgi:hypothetical protein